MGDKGKVALLTGVPGAFNLEERIRGFKDGVKDYPGIQIVKTVACNDDINQGVQVVEETMQANPDLNGWFFVGLWPLFAEARFHEALGRGRQGREAEDDRLRHPARGARIREGRLPRPGWSARSTGAGAMTPSR